MSVIANALEEGPVAAGAGVAGEFGASVSPVPRVGGDTLVGATPTGLPGPHPTATIKTISSGSVLTAHCRIRQAKSGKVEWMVMLRSIIGPSS